MKKRTMNMTKVMMPIVMTKYRHPSFAGQLAMKNQAISEELSCPIGHHTERRVRRELEASGRNSRNRAPSTGRLPPTPNPSAPNKKQTPLQLVAYEEAIPKTLVMRRVRLKAMRRPKISDPRPQKKLPKHNPTKRALVVYRTVFSDTPNSTERDGKVRDTP
jgi:hypothetical protein